MEDTPINEQILETGKTLVSLTTRLKRLVYEKERQLVDTDWIMITEISPQPESGDLCGYWSVGLEDPIAVFGQYVNRITSGYWCRISLPAPPCLQTKTDPR